MTDARIVQAILWCVGFIVGGGGLYVLGWGIAISGRPFGGAIVVSGIIAAGYGLFSLVLGQTTLYGLTLWRFL